MDYEKAYNEAYERAKKNYDTAQDLCEGSQIGVECFKNTLTNIFPEIGENEDEKIRKRLIDLIYKVYVNTNYITCVELENMRAWLEKQSDTTSDIRYDGVNAGASLSVINGKPFDYEHATITHKDFAPKPTEWSDEDENYLQSAENACEYQYGKNTSTILWLKSLKDRVQPKQEWSEEDDYNLQCMIAKVTYDIQKGNVGRNNELIDWLKSLKDRMKGKEEKK